MDAEEIAPLLWNLYQAMQMNIHYGNKNMYSTLIIYIWMKCPVAPFTNMD